MTGAHGAGAIVVQGKVEDRHAMPLPEFISWAWRETSPVHRNPANLLIHLFAVPLFLAGHVLIFLGLLSDGRLLIAGPLCVLVSLYLQKVGHALEQVPPIPFSGPRDFFRRVYVEQLINFWRFLLSGQWYANYKAATR